MVKQKNIEQKIVYNSIVKITSTTVKRDLKVPYHIEKQGQSIGTGFFIDKKGNVTQVWVQKGIPNTGLNEAALEAVKRTRWKPARQRDKKVGVWMSIPINFKLTSN